MREDHGDGIAFGVREASGQGPVGETRSGPWRTSGAGHCWAQPALLYTVSPIPPAVNPRGWVALILGAALLLFASGIITLGVNKMLSGGDLTPGAVVALIGVVVLVVGVLVVSLGLPTETRGAVPPASPPWPPPSPPARPPWP